MTVYEAGVFLAVAPFIGITIGFITHELFRRWVND
jgi:hypothetical protein